MSFFNNSNDPRERARAYDSDMGMGYSHSGWTGSQSPGEQMFGVQYDPTGSYNFFRSQGGQSGTQAPAQVPTQFVTANDFGGLESAMSQREQQAANNFWQNIRTRQEAQKQANDNALRWAQMQQQANQQAQVMDLNRQGQWFTQYQKLAFDNPLARQNADDRFAEHQDDYDLRSQAQTHKEKYDNSMLGLSREGMQFQKDSADPSNPINSGRNYGSAVNAVANGTMSPDVAGNVFFLPDQYKQNLQGIAKSAKYLQNKANYDAASGYADTINSIQDLQSKADAADKASKGFWGGRVKDTDPSYTAWTTATAELAKAKVILANAQKAPNKMGLTTEVKNGQVIYKPMMSAPAQEDEANAPTVFSQAKNNPTPQYSPRQIERQNYYKDLQSQGMDRTTAWQNAFRKYPKIQEDMSANPISNYEIVGGVSPSDLRALADRARQYERTMSHREALLKAQNEMALEKNQAATAVANSLNGANIQPRYDIVDVGSTTTNPSSETGFRRGSGASGARTDGSSRLSDDMQSYINSIANQAQKNIHYSITHAPTNTVPIQLADAVDYYRRLGYNDQEAMSLAQLEGIYGADYTPAPVGPPLPKDDPWDWKHFRTSFQYRAPQTN